VPGRKKRSYSRLRNEERWVGDEDATPRWDDAGYESLRKKSAE